MTINQKRLIIGVAVLAILGLSGYFIFVKKFEPVSLQTEPNSPDKRPETSVSDSQPSITLLSPNGGEVWQFGSMQNVRWDGPTTGYKFVLERGISLIPVTLKSKVDAFPHEAVSVIPEGETNAFVRVGDSMGSQKDTFLKISLCPSDQPDAYCANVDLSKYGFDVSDEPFTVVGDDLR